MTSLNEDIVTFPPPAPSQTYVTISALQAGHLTLPEKLFVTDADPEKRATVPSLSFLIQHPSTQNPSTTDKLVFDLGLKRDFSGYREAQQHHIAQRQPTVVSPDAGESLRNGGLELKDVNTVVLSHVHWDHVGTPGDFANAEFVVGSGTMNVLANGGGPLYPAEFFNADELPEERTRELPSVRPEDNKNASSRQTNHTWLPLAGFPATVDFYGDGSVYLIDTPGHLTGHVNLLGRTGPKNWVYLGGDCCHDPRILSGEKGIALYDDGRGGMRSVHANTNEAAKAVKRIARLMKKGNIVQKGGGKVNVEVVVAHDKEWAEQNKERFWPAHL
ncbi:beta-lactamase-like protein [Pyrenochaeta sp. MPI-SDFR-AT-0127]|nr:beta-lactamase-like protein [Pyrenochaeta sp. MPI-SDFR-AT-0127]